MEQKTNNENSDLSLAWNLTVSGVAVSAVGLGMMAAGISSKSGDLGALGAGITQVASTVGLCASIYGLMNSQHQGTVQEAPVLEKSK
jgi:hypothetical protein